MVNNAPNPPQILPAHRSAKLKAKFKIITPTKGNANERLAKRIEKRDLFGRHKEAKKLEDSQDALSRTRAQAGLDRE